MKILLVSNKTYRGTPDLGYWYLQKPLEDIGHTVYWYDTVKPEESNFDKVVEKFKPDLIFCCMTGDPMITPCEPWESILKETQSGRTKTFNWFCDETWRFKSFSSKACKHFNVCSTTEPAYVQKFKEIGYNNIMLANWHANSDFYSKIKFEDKDVNLSFIGFPTPKRESFFKVSGLPIENFYGLSHEEMFMVHSRSKIGLNLSKNDNDMENKTQMKQRIFEIPAGGGLLLTEHHEGIEEFFAIDKEIVTFKTIEELKKKAELLLKRPKLLEKISSNGHKRFLKEHDSKVRLAKVLEDINKF